MLILSVKIPASKLHTNGRDNQKFVSLILLEDISKRILHSSPQKQGCSSEGIPEQYPA